MAKGMVWTMVCFLSRTVLSEGFKGTDENSCSFHGGEKRAEMREGRSLQSIFIIYLRVSSDWLLPDLCPMARANSRAIAHGYLLLLDLANLLSYWKIRDLTVGFPNPTSCSRPFSFSFSFFIPITSNHRDAGNGKSYSRDAKFRVRKVRADFRRSARRARRYKIVGAKKKRWTINDKTLHRLGKHPG